MKETTIKYLSCPYCKTSDFGLSVNKREDKEILSGKLFCKKCGKSYEIASGILNTVVPEYVKRPGKFSTMIYNLYAPFYDSLEGFFGKLLGLSEAGIREDLIKRLELSEGDTILEVAIGTGKNIPIIRKYTRGTIFGLDLSEGMLRRCLEKRAYGEIELFYGNAECLPFKVNRFDAVLNLGGISYFSDARKAIEEMYRVAKPGSKVVISEQITFLEKLLDRDKPPVELVPKDAVQIKSECTFGGHFYVIEFKKPLSLNIEGSRKCVKLNN